MMDTESSTKILLTGAGFTYNFGTPLANGMWEQIFNHRLIQSEPRVRQLLLSDCDFESAYNAVMTGSYSAQEKSAVIRAVYSAYDRLDSIVRAYQPGGDVQFPIDLNNVITCIEQFRRQQGKSFFFTLNQDLFVERRCHGRLQPTLLGVGMSLYNTDRPLQEADYQTLPSRPELEARKQECLSNSEFFYVKLHGSQNWRSASRDRQIVIGRGKAEQIRDEPLLDWYSELFTRTLSQPNRSLLVIGYGFGDDHINESIAAAIVDYQLKVYVICPLGMKELKAAAMERSNNGQSLIRTIFADGLAGYFTNSLSQMFPGTGRVTEACRSLYEHFFEVSNYHRGR